MAGGVYLLRGDDDFLPMTEAPYDSEDVLQALIAKFPDLLAGDQLPGAEPRRWLLIRREAALGSDDSGGPRWSIDHLFFDQDSIPTIVETKRSSDTRIRREVVGQMLDYAANAVVYWSIADLRAAFEKRCEEESRDPEADITALIGLDADVEEFWKRAETNLQAGRVRLVFVADEIPSELRRVVEFLNVQMNPAEVIAIEVKQYVAEGHKTLVPRFIGQTAAAETKKRAGGPGRRWNEESFFPLLEEKAGPDAVRAARTLFDWATANNLRMDWGSGKVHGSFIPVLVVGKSHGYPLVCYTYGGVEVNFQFMTAPPFDDYDLRRELLARLNKLPGVSIPDDAITRRPRIELALLGRDETMLRDFIAIFDWFCEKIRQSA